MRFRGLAVPRRDVIPERLDGGSGAGKGALDIRETADAYICHLDLVTSKSAARGDRTALQNFGGVLDAVFLEEQLTSENLR